MSGIGVVFAPVLAAQGTDLILVARMVLEPQRRRKTTVTLISDTDEILATIEIDLSGR